MWVSASAAVTAGRVNARAAKETPGRDDVTGAATGHLSDAGGTGEEWESEALKEGRKESPSGHFCTFPIPQMSLAQTLHQRQPPSSVPRDGSGTLDVLSLIILE